MFGLPWETSVCRKIKVLGIFINFLDVMKGLAPELIKYLNPDSEPEKLIRVDRATIAKNNFKVTID